MGQPRTTPNHPHASGPAQGPAAVQPDALASRHTLLLGLLGGLLLLVFFIYPATSYPLQALLFTGIMLAAAAGLTVQITRAGGAPRAALASALGGVPALAMLLFILWAALRWRQAEVPALGREWVVSLLALGVALTLGCGLGALERARPDAPAAFTILARLVIVTTLGLGLYAIYQYEVIYPRAYAELKASLTGPVADYQTQSLLHAYSERRVGGTLGDANLFAAQLAVFLLICLSALGREVSRPWRALGVAGAAAAGGAILLSASRGGLLTALLALGWAAGLLFSGRRRPGTGPITPARAALFALVLGVAASPAAHAAGLTLLQRLGNIATIRERLFYWRIALKVWARHPLIGEGPGGFSLLYLTFKDPVARESQFAHSWLFQVGAELGLIGLGLMLLFWLGGVGRALARRRQGELHPDVPWILGALVLLAFNGLFESSLQWHPFLMATGLLGGLLAGLTAPLAAGRPSPAARVRGAVGLTLAAAVGVLALVVTPVHDLARLHAANAEAAAMVGEWSEAARGYTAALALTPQDPVLHLGLAWMLDRLDSPAPAWQHLEEAARLNPRSAAVRDAEALWLDRQGRPEDAILKVGEAIERYPANVAYRMDRARLLLKAGRAAPAAADLQFIERGALPVWEFQQDAYNDLRAAAGLPRLPKESIPK